MHACPVTSNLYLTGLTHWHQVLYMFQITPAMPITRYDSRYSSLRNDARAIRSWFHTSKDVT
ncbi:hypothetical protein PISMIDRAFT_539964 [Pisolithus microcarpus 441]|uniref:Uncharacterized protein n=1 Tax=Pisolithus microcarpus 441 TaxID=765257 RepID=A0A0C9ZG95_9AGAM|nr:hypothetical protein PISMIDRAFT_539964 [Pisolithus microcarpus 441]